MAGKKKKMEAPNRNKKAVIRKIEGRRIFYLCPKCHQIWTQKRKSHRNLCMACGQYLDWSGTDQTECIWLSCRNMEEAYYAAKKYEEINGSTYGIDLEAWRLHSDRIWPKVLYFPFLNKTGYGRFMRWAAKDGPEILNMGE